MEETKVFKPQRKHLKVGTIGVEVVSTNATLRVEVKAGSELEDEDPFRVGTELCGFLVEVRSVVVTNRAVVVPKKATVTEVSVIVLTVAISEERLTVVV